MYAILEDFPVEHVFLTLFICSQLPDAHSVLSRIIDLVSPGGWLLIDEIDWTEAFDGLDKAPGVKRGLTALVKSMEAEAGDPHYGKSLKPYLEASDKLSEVHVREVELPVYPVPEGMTRLSISSVINLILQSLVWLVSPR
jgi:hypothetical protein